MGPGLYTQLFGARFLNFLLRKLSREFKLPTISEAVHPGGDDRSPLRGFLVYLYLYRVDKNTVHF